MREFRGDETLAFTAEEAAAIRAAEAWGQPVTHSGPARSAKHLALGFAASTLLCILTPWPHLFRKEALTRPPAVLALVRRSVHLRARPSTTAQTLGVLPAGSLVRVLESRADGFDRVVAGNLEGYSASTYLTPTPGVEAISPIDARIAAIAGYGRVRERPSLDAPAVERVTAEVPVRVVGVMPSGWCLVVMGRRAGFVWGGLLDDQPSLPFRPRQDGPERVVLLQGTVLRP